MHAGVFVWGNGGNGFSGFNGFKGEGAARKIRKRRENLNKTLQQAMVSYVILCMSHCNSSMHKFCGRREACYSMLGSFFLSVAASVVAYYICKWLDR